MEKNNKKKNKNKNKYVDYLLGILGLVLLGIIGYFVSDFVEPKGVIDDFNSFVVDSQQNKVFTKK